MQTALPQGQGLSLRRLLPECEILRAADIGVSGCTVEERRVKPGQLFVVLRNSHDDARRRIAAAVARGCAAVLCEPPPPQTQVPVCLVPNALEAYGRLCQALAGNPSSQLHVVGVTGTSGKTTTSWLIAAVLEAGGFEVGLLGTLGYFDGESWEPAPWTTPPHDHLATRLARMVQNGCSHAVVEISGRAMERQRLAGVRLDAACVTNVQPLPLDYQATNADSRLARSRIFRHLPPEGLAVLNADDPTVASYLRRLDCPVLTVGVRSAAEIMATPVEQTLSEQTFLLTAGSETVPVRTRLVGLHNVYNCLSAAAIGLAYGIDLMAVARGLESVACVPGRLERLECGQPFAVFVDSAATSETLVAVLRTLRGLTPGRLLCVAGTDGARDQHQRAALGHALARQADLVVLTTDTPSSRAPDAMIAELLADANESPRNVEVLLDRAAAIRWTLASARPGDCVLIAGKERQKGQFFGQHRSPFDDREVARQWLYDVKPFAEDDPCQAA